LSATARTAAPVFKRPKRPSALRNNTKSSRISPDAKVLRRHPMDNFLSIVQRALEVTPIRGKGRLAGLVLNGKESEVACHPLHGLTIRLNPKQRIERLMWAGAYEPRLVRMLKSCLRPGMFFLDLGANIGYFSAIAAALVG